MLIATIPHRHGQLLDLLSVLDAQVQPGFSVLAYRDNLETTLAPKLQALLDAATAEYVSVISDDDSVSPDCVPRMMEALRSRPDQVGYRARYVRDGAPVKPVVHSLACGGWIDDGPEFQRDIFYFSPVRRELARQVRFRDINIDGKWAADMRALGIIRTEVFIDDELFYYQGSSADNIATVRQPLPAESITPLPAYPWLTFLEPDCV
jgi:hypothetical protein